MEIFLTVSVFIEIFLLAWIEKRMWKTYFTPLNFLIAPYAVALVVTLVVEGRFGIVPFYYPSLIPWILGMPIFAVPSWILFVLTHKKNLSLPPVKQKEDGALSWKIILAYIIGVFLGIWLLVLLNTADCQIGSERFGHLFAGAGFTGHLLVIGMALLLFLSASLQKVRKHPVFRFDRNNLLMKCVLLLLLFFLVVYQTKSWILLPLIAAFLTYLISDRIKLKISHLIGVVAAGAGVFFLSYLLIYFSGNTLFPESSTLGAQLKSISGLWVHYVTSGTFGLSMDMQNGILEPCQWRYLFPPFLGIPADGNIPEWFHTGLNFTNVRTLIGSIYIFSGPAGFSFFVFGLSTVCYLFFDLYRKTKHFYALLLYAWLCTVLFMGWFDSYLSLLNTYEIPFWLLVFYGIDTLCERKRRQPQEKPIFTGSK